MEFNLRAALSPSRLKPELRATGLGKLPSDVFGVRPSGCTGPSRLKPELQATGLGEASERQVWSSAFGLHWSEQAKA